MKDLKIWKKIILTPEAFLFNHDLWYSFLKRYQKSGGNIAILLPKIYENVRTRILMLFRPYRYYQQCWQNAVNPFCENSAFLFDCLYTWMSMYLHTQDIPFPMHVLYCVKSLGCLCGQWAIHKQLNICAVEIMNHVLCTI